MSIILSPQANQGPQRLYHDIYDDRSAIDRVLETHQMALNPYLSLLDIAHTLDYPVKVTPNDRVKHPGKVIDALRLPSHDMYHHREPYWHLRTLWPRLGGNVLFDIPRPITAYDHFVHLTGGQFRQAKIRVHGQRAPKVYFRHLRLLGKPLLSTPEFAKHLRYPSCIWDKPVPNHEYLVRLRRSAAFIDAAGLLPFGFLNRSPHGDESSLASVIGRVMMMDHVTHFSDILGVHYLLNQPYYDLSSKFGLLESVGIAAIEVPITLASYGGGWDATPGALPGTHAYLMTALAFRDRLLTIEKRLQQAAANMPVWNDTVGVQP